MKLCECGCGQPAPIATRTDPRRGDVKGQPKRFIVGHFSKTRRRTAGYHQVSSQEPGRGRCVKAHILIAEKVLGRRLPRGAEVHHVDGNTLNNAHPNLVICQDRAYHALLHARARVRDAGGNPNADGICSLCRQALPLSAFPKNMRAGRSYWCLSCRRAKRHAKQESGPLVACACGCGAVLRLRDREGRVRKFVSGHNGRKEA